MPLNTTCENIARWIHLSFRANSRPQILHNPVHRLRYLNIFTKSLTSRLDPSSDRLFVGMQKTCLQNN